LSFTASMVRASKSASCAARSVRTTISVSDAVGAVFDDYRRTQTELSRHQAHTGDLDRIRRKAELTGDLVYRVHGGRGLFGSPQPEDALTSAHALRRGRVVPMGERDFRRSSGKSRCHLRHRTCDRRVGGAATWRPTQGGGNL
jgi:hypothetical protein